MTALAQAPGVTPAEHLLASLMRPAAPTFGAHTVAATPAAARGDGGSRSSTLARRTVLGPERAELRFPPSTPPVAATPRGAAPPHTQPHPRARLLTAPPPGHASRVQGPPLAVPPTLGERVRVLRAGDRSFVTEADDEDRGLPPSTDPGLVVRRLATASVEVLAGLRPAAQLARWLAPAVLDALRVRSTLGRRASIGPCRAAACRSVRVARVDPRAVEATAVVDDGRRVRAVAIRLEAHRGHWRATALEVG